MPSVICSSESSHSPPLFYASFALLGHCSCLTRPPFTLCSLLVFCVPPFPPYLAPSVKHTTLPICSLSLSLFCTARSAVLPRPLYSQRWRGAARRYTWEAHLGYSCAAAIAASCVGRWVSVCVFCMHMFVLWAVCVCVWIRLSGAAIWGRSSHLGLQMSLPLHIVLKLLSAASLCVLALPLLFLSLCVGVFRWLIVAWPFLTTAVVRELGEILHPGELKAACVLVWRIWQQSVRPAGLFFSCICASACVGDRGNLCFAIC